MTGGRVVREFSFKLNGQPVSVKAPPAYTLLETLRYVLKLTGTKDGCSSGDCGACTVLLNGRAVHSCLTLTAQVQGMDVVTVEGADPRIVEAFASEGAVQCGYCTPGLVMATEDLLRENPKPSTDDIRESLRGNLCRCTGYVKIVKAVKTAAGV
ncbi:MAG: (2Fe-2S)-binding protein [Candidatus Caldarchaeum sp.]